MPRGYKQYPSYRESGVEWLGDIPESWNPTRLKYISNVNMGQSPSSSTYNDNGYGVEFLQGNADFGSIYPTARVYTTDAKKTSNLDDILFTVRAPVGAMNISNKNYAIGRGLCAIGVTNNSYRAYLWWLMLNIKVELDSISTGSTYEAVSVEQVNNSTVSLPPLQEQKTIASYLDKATTKIDTLIEKQTKLIELLKEKRQAVISSAVTRGLDASVPMKDSGVEWLGEIPEHWQALAIKRLSTIGRGASPRPIDDPQYFDDEGEYAWVRIADVSKSDGSLNSTKQQLSSLGSSLSVKLNIGDLFISIAGTVGKPCISNIKACIHDGFVYFPLLSRKYISLIYRIFESGECYGGLGKMGTQLNLNTETIGNINIAVPPDDELQLLIEHIRKKLLTLDTLITKSTQAIDLLKEKRTALISAAVTGKIDVRDAA